MNDETKIKTSGPYPFAGPVANGENENPRAHGGVVWVDTNHDGSWRYRNTNGAHEEIGPWYPEGVGR
jgi:hypothetical protein